MDIRVADYTQNGRRVLSTECSLCQTCISVCAQNALKLSFGLDVGGTERLRERKASAERPRGPVSAAEHRPGYTDIPVSD